MTLRLSMEETEMVRIEKVNGKNVWEILGLRVREDQKSFVAANETSIIEAYTTITAGTRTRGRQDGLRAKR